jgi:hypothetical protein
MGFSWSKLAKDPMTYVAPGLSVAAQLLSKDGTNVNQEILETPEQRAARQRLSMFSQTGKYGDFTAGEKYSGSLGDFTPTEMELLSQSKLGGLLSSGMGSSFEMGDQALSDLLTTEKYNPLNQAGVYEPLRGRMERDTREASDAYKRQTAFGGNLYSSDTMRQLGDIQAKGAESLGTTMAGLYDNYVGRKVGAIPQAFNAAAQKESTEQSRIRMGSELGGLERILNTARDQAGYQEWQRARQESTMPIQTAQSLATTNPQYGVKDMSLPGTNGWDRILDLMAQFGGKALGTAMGG